MNVHEAKLELAILETDVVETNRADFVTYLTNSGIPQEIINRVTQLWDVTKRIGEEVVSIGKIIIFKIWEFLKANPHLSAGMALGASVSILIPFVGPILAPLATAVGALLGVRLDNYSDGNEMANNMTGVAHEAVLLAKKFFDLFVEIVDAVKVYLDAREA
ncbi:hypothetical protein [Thiomicrorhabdus sp. Milos-T2]|uniref:hypothetical protein n=1 Tax=Thiomicrorhabdus sp. Milos-T2 TaxID=90814 RepID=UPI0004943529|nr:hypothetical protein [Thiomicrorhabdus sp. Milos-T2]